MTKINDHRDGAESVNDEAPALPAPDPRKPYEAPRLVKKRSVARATLFTVVGTMATGLTTQG